MGCESCSSGGGSPTGCGNKGHCQTGGCNKKNTYDWLSAWQVTDAQPFNIVEVSFKQGAFKSFYRIPELLSVSTGDYVAVSPGSGYDVGRVTLSGELVRLQMKKKRVKEDRVVHEVIRLASTRDIERMREARGKERDTLVQSRAIVRSIGLDMKMGDVQYQADLRKATFYYTSEGRVDFRTLVRELARSFNVKVEMRQIGARQESSRIGGIGSCGRELCCSTWLSDFKTVTTSAARYQNLAINQVKLSGQCGRLKCCLNYELDTYVAALKEFPTKANHLRTTTTKAYLIKTDIFREVMHYAYKTEFGRQMVVSIHRDRVWEIYEMNKAGEFPEAFITEEDLALEEEMDFADVTGVIELKEEVKRKRRKNRRKGGRNRRNNKSSGGSQSRGSRDNTDGRGQGSKSKNKDPQENREGSSSKRHSGAPSNDSRSSGRRSKRRPPKRKSDQRTQGNKQQPPKNDGGSKPS